MDVSDVYVLSIINYTYHIIPTAAVLVDDTFLKKDKTYHTTPHISNTIVIYGCIYTTTKIRE